MNGTPSNETTGHDEERVDRLGPIQAAITALAMPYLNTLKVLGILDAIELQIEDGGDSEDVNALLLDALRAAVRHQVGEDAGAAALRAIDAFAQIEAKHWEDVRAGRYQSPADRPAARIRRLVYGAQSLVDRRDPIGASDRFLEAWEIVKAETTPEIRTLQAFDAALGAPDLDSAYWVVNLQYELWNAGLQDPAYHEHRIRVAEEVLTLFPDSSDNTVVNIRQGEADSLSALGRRDEAEAIYADLAERFPNNVFVYAGWADLFFASYHGPERRDVARAEAILKRGLKQRRLEDRDAILERLSALREERRGPAAQAPAIAEPGARQGRPHERPGRNDPCWCGSGKKYKHCHMHADRLAEG